MSNHNIQYGGSDTESERSKDEATCPPSDQKIAALEGLPLTMQSPPLTNPREQVTSKLSPKTAS